MNKQKALDIIEGIIHSLDTSSSCGEEIDWALEQVSSDREELQKALNYLKELE